MTGSEKRNRWGKGRGRLVVVCLLLLAVSAALYPIGRYAWASAHYQRALAAIERRDFSSARRHLGVCVGEWPSSGETCFLAARTARRDGDFKSAQQLLKGAEGLGWVPEAIELERGLLSLQMGRYQTTSPVLMSLVRKGHPDS